MLSGLSYCKGRHTTEFQVIQILLCFSFTFFNSLRCIVCGSCFKNIFSPASYWLRSDRLALVKKLSRELGIYNSCAFTKPRALNLS